jgi:hypothetical protein
MTIKVTEVVLIFYRLSNQSYGINKLAGQKTNKHIKTLSNSLESFAQVAPLDRTFHKDSNKI